MIKFFTSTFSTINIYKKNCIKSEVVTQLIYGESFSILKKSNQWFKIKIKEDGYKGFVQKKNFKRVTLGGFMFNLSGKKIIMTKENRNNKEI